jgi:choline dehydrogenase-like flavoprotein
MTIIKNPAQLVAHTNDAAIRASVCVIGSGFSGAIVAVELAAAGIDVVVLEAGTTDPDHRIEAMLDRIDVPGRMELRFGFARQLGGASNLWAGRVAPFEPVDFERRDWIPGSGWPLAVADLEPYYRRAAEILGIPGHGAFDVRDHERPGFLQADRIELKSFQWAPKPFHAGEYLRAAAERSGRLRVLLDAPVVELRERDDARAVEAALVALPGGRAMRVEADCFVVAAGGIQTPRLLLNSTGVRPAGIGNDRGVVGRYLSTHPKANMASLVLKRPVSTRHALFTDRRIEGGVVRLGAGFTAAAQREHRLLNHYVQVLPFAEYRANRLFEAARGSGAFNSPLIDRSRLISGFLPGAGKVAFEMIGRAGGLQRRTRKFILRAFLDQYPNADNRVTLSRRRDAHGMPLADVHWAFSADDRASVLRFFECLERELHAGGGVERVDFSRLRTLEEWPLIGIHSHFMGTTRMGGDPSTSVTDGDCRVHGSENLYVAGPSLFPVYGYANPVYNISALALRLGGHLRTRFSGARP